MNDLLPVAEEAESCVVGCGFLSPACLVDVIPLITPGDFHDPRKRTVYDCQVRRHKSGQPINAKLVLEDLRTSGDLDRIGGMAFIAELADSVVSVAHAAHHAQQVRQASQRRQLIAAAAKLQEAAAAGVDIGEAIGTAEKSLRRIDELGAPLAITDAREAAREGITRICAAKQGRGSIGLPSGFDDYDQLTGGWFPGELIVPAGRPGDGKTTFTVQTARHVAEAGGRVLYVTLEMGASDLALRTMAGDARVSSVDVRGGTITDDELAELVAAADAFGALPLHLLDAPRCSVGDIRRAARQLHRTHGDLSLVCIDYIGLLTATDARLPRHEQVSQITRDLKQLARDMSLPVIALAQLNRGSEQAKGRPRLSNLRESGSIEQDADVVLFLHRPEVAKPDDPDLANVTELIVAKNRSGPTGDIELFFDKARTRFGSLTRRYTEFDTYNANAF